MIDEYEIEAAEAAKELAKQKKMIAKSLITSTSTKTKSTTSSLPQPQNSSSIHARPSSPEPSPKLLKKVLQAGFFLFHF